MQNLYELLEIFENFEKILRKFWRNFSKLSYLLILFKINFLNHYKSGKNWGGGHVPPTSKDSKMGGGPRAPRPPTDRLWRRERASDELAFKSFIPKITLPILSFESVALPMLIKYGEVHWARLYYEYSYITVSVALLKVYSTLNVYVHYFFKV